MDVFIDLAKQIVHQSHNNVLVNTLLTQAPAASLPDNDEVGRVLHTVATVLVFCRANADLESKSDVYIDSSE